MKMNLCYSQSFYSSIQVRLLGMYVALNLCQPGSFHPSPSFTRFYELGGPGIGDKYMSGLMLSLALMASILPFAAAGLKKMTLHTNSDKEVFIFGAGGKKVIAK